MKIDSLFLNLILVIVVLLVDSIIVKTYGFTNSRMPGVFDLVLFASFVFAFVAINIMILRTVKNLKIHPRTKRFYPAIWGNQGIIAILLITLLIEIGIYSYYDRNIFLSIVYFSFFASILFSTILVVKLFQWFRYNQNYIVLLYGLAFSMLIVKFMIGSIYVSQEILSHNPIVVPSQTREMIMDLSNINAALSSALNNAYDYVSISSYIIIWVATILLLRQYSDKFGRVKYWILVCIPLAYYLAEDRILLLSPLSALILVAPNLFGIIHTLFFGAVQLVGGLLFGIAFFTIARKITQENISTSLKLSGIGIVILIGSNEIFGVYVGAYPPYGLVSVSFMPLASYLLLTGILSSAVLISNNLRLRNELYKMAERQPSLLRDIGFAEMESEIEGKVNKILQTTTLTDQEFVADTADMKNYADEVVKELQKKR